ncbi:hypothetical protein [Saccharopolyspora sp. NPDC002686]|uniref:hypothetical protein n=1 Tax=Saccharopolyspora sp. NPDC002686 TaxID=3154541 RepID=UPI0033344FB5
MDEVEEARLPKSAATRAVCAHIGIGSDVREARVARDRLDTVLASYRVAFLRQEASGAPTSR